MNVTYIANTIQDTKKLANAIANSLQKTDLFYINGELGTGKTTLVQLIIANFSKEQVISPTFPIIQSYHTTLGDIYHIDLYRVQPTEINNLGLDEIFNFYPCFVEWANKLGTHHQKEAININIKNIMATQREFILHIPKNYNHYANLVEKLHS